MDNGKKIIVDNVLYVPGLMRNLLSISQSKTKKKILLWNLMQENALLRICKKRYKVVVQAIEEDGMYMLDTSRK